MNALLLAGLLAAGLPQAPEPVLASRPASPYPVIDARIRAVLVADALPRRDVVEVRPRIGLVATAIHSARVTSSIDVTLDALLARRDGRVTDLTAQVRDGWIEWRGDRADVRAGYGRVIWGRLDEIAPTDVINPLDTARFLLEGRSEARLAVPFARVRLAPSERLQLDAVLVPALRRGTFDRAAEPSSPFNLTAGAVAPPGVEIAPGDREQRIPAVAWQNVSGGGRAQLTARGIDVAGSFYRGFDAIGPVVAEPWPAGGPAAVRLVEHHPRFTMAGADAEMVRGPWAWRGELAMFVERTFAASTGAGLVSGRSIDAGVGFDRRVGAFRVFGSALVHREWSGEDPGIERTDVNLVGSLDRTFGRDRYLTRIFAVVNPNDASVFVRGLAAWNASDRFGVEVSGGAFAGTSDDTIGRFRTRDFVLARLRCDF